eukprot:TRINITY_DN10322_c1_g1_i1.p1 TRINITY_DN10322_c1_g1~~TRINITY_DN10322_c1_g1_i1.p1  ORF type:complete len:139 (+),score=52.00 TRINITY_DN10322_c1_g1_i1:558-974(+)
MSTGVQVAADCITEFNEFKLRNKYRYIIFHVANNQVAIEKTAAPDATYDQFLADLPADDCRYAVFNFEYDAGADGKRSKVVFILWAPETSKIKSKMIYAGTKDTVKKAFQGLQVEIQGTDKSEVDKDAILAKCQSVSK